MKKTIILAYLALIFSFLLPFVGLYRENQVPEETEVEIETIAETPPPAPSPEGKGPEISRTAAMTPAPEKMKLLTEGGVQEMDMQEYLIGVVAAEMPADFDYEALKAQAVAARSYAIYCAQSNKHEGGAVCADFNCCQAYIDEEQMRKNWGEAYEEKHKKIASAVAETKGEYLSYEGKAVFAAFHSASSGATEDCGEVWNSLPYLKSVKTPENEKTVPDFVSTLLCAPIDFRDCILSRFPDADFTGDESSWIGRAELDKSGRVRKIILGGKEIKGTELRQLFSLRSTAFTLRYIDGKFLFTVKGFGHGVGMSQYGAKVMAREGADYKSILAHYYPGTSFVT